MQACLSRGKVWLGLRMNMKKTKLMCDSFAENNPTNIGIQRWVFGWNQVFNQIYRIKILMPNIMQRIR